MKIKKILTITILALFLLIGKESLASTTSGTISTPYNYAWGENVGFIDFINVTITDTSLSGSIYGENIGWIIPYNITNNNEGTLSGYAWGENVGWVHFQGVVINTDGVFTGQAYGENIGWITFNTNDNNKVTTDWRPRSTRTTHSGGGGGGGGAPTPALVYCPAGVTFDTVTGKKCTAVTPTTNNCPPGALFNPLNGEKCSTPTQPEIVSCPVGFIFNNITGKRCTTYTQVPPTVTTTGLLTKPLFLNITDPEVKTLQIYLNTHGYIIATTGNGSPGKETTFFGQRTKNAVIKFQIANNLKPDGVVGPMVRSKLK